MDAAYYEYESLSPPLSPHVRSPDSLLSALIVGAGPCRLQNLRKMEDIFSYSMALISNCGEYTLLVLIQMPYMHANHASDIQRL